MDTNERLNINKSFGENYKDRGAWWAIVHGVAESDTTEETHTHILAWRIPWTEEPGKLQSILCKESDTIEMS